MSGYSSMFKETLSPCYDNVQKKGWHGGKRKQRKKPLKKLKKKKHLLNPKKTSKNLRLNLKNKEEG